MNRDSRSKFDKPGLFYIQYDQQDIIPIVSRRAMNQLVSGVG